MVRTCNPSAAAEDAGVRHTSSSCNSEAKMSAKGTPKVLPDKAVPSNAARHPGVHRAVGRLFSWDRCSLRHGSWAQWRAVIDKHCSAVYRNAEACEWSMTRRAAIADMCYSSAQWEQDSSSDDGPPLLRDSVAAVQQHYNPDQDVVLRSEYIPEKQFKARQSIVASGHAAYSAAHS